MLTILYQIIIMPLIQLTEFFYELFFEVTGNQGIAVIGLSFVVTLFTLPLYMVAEKWQETERQIQKKLKPGVERIKNTFKGDEQYMLLSTFYRENKYHPIMALRSSFSLLIQIPFFIAAYNFLSNLEPLKDYSFLFIKNFGAPDATFRIGSFAINILPIAMTIINCVAGAVYSKGHPVAEKIQIYTCAAVFLILLYNSPAGLVVYWTMNNILSLVKNIFYKIKNPKKVLYCIACTFAVLLLVLSAFILKDTKTIFRLALVIFALIIPFIPLIIKLFDAFITNNFKPLNDNPKIRLTVFLLSAVSLAVLAGLVIPSTLIESEPEQYCYVDGYKSPFVFIAVTVFQAIGFFIVWPGCFYALFSWKTKKGITLLFACTTFIAVLNCFAFSGNYGPITPHLIFMQPQKFSVSLTELLLNAACIAALIVFVVLLMNKNIRIMQSVSAVLLIALSAIAVKNTACIQSAYSRMDAPEIKDDIEPVFHLSKTGKNVVILMQDRCFSQFIPVFFEQNPDFKEKYDGFTFYPNCTSFAVYTMLGTPGIFGGYDYTPFEINQRTDKTLQQKHNEAILSMPVVFHENGWNTAVADMPYENYLEQPVEQMYKDYPFVDRVVTHGVYSDVWYKRNNMKKYPVKSIQIKRNFIWFSFFKMVSPALRQIVYHKEYWLSSDGFENNTQFIDNYSEIDFLPELVDFSADKNSFLLLDNEATHEPIFLQAPEYIPVENVSDYGGGYLSNNKQYHSMAGILMRFANFINYLKVNDMYDNTRIIIVSDHGTNHKTGLFEQTPDIPILKDNFTATLMVKDFSSHGSIKTDMTFMTNADTPALATKDIISNAKNPFTGNKFNVENKAEFVKLASAPAESTRIRTNTQFKVADDHWFTVKDNIFEAKNWSRWIKE